MITYHPMKIFRNRVLSNKKGMSYVYVCVIILILSMLISLVFSYASLMTITSKAKDNSQRVLDGFCIEKAIEINKSIKNGNKYMISNEYTDPFMERISKELLLTNVDNSRNIWYNTDGENDDIIFRFDNPLTANLEDNTLTLQMDYELVIPINFGGIDFSDLRIPIRIKSVYNVK